MNRPHPSRRLSPADQYVADLREIDSARNAATAAIDRADASLTKAEILLAGISARKGIGQ